MYKKEGTQEILKKICSMPAVFVGTIDEECAHPLADSDGIFAFCSEADAEMFMERMAEYLAEGTQMFTEQVVSLLEVSSLNFIAEKCIIEQLH